MRSQTSDLPLSEYPARRILVIKPSALGDIIHSLPVLTALRRRYPAAHISWIVNRGYEPLLRGHPDDTLYIVQHHAFLLYVGLLGLWLAAVGLIWHSVQISRR